MRSELPRARMEVKGAAGHLERAAAEARERARVVRQRAAPVARLVAVAAGIFLLFGLIAAITAPCYPRSSDDQRARVRQLQVDLRQLDAQLEALRHQLPDRPVVLISEPTPTVETDPADPAPR